MSRLQDIALRNLDLPWLNGRERAVLKNIANCLTIRMGGNESYCECGNHETHYNSCRDRHCPLCQGAARARWVKDRMRELLPVSYFHVVFTVPHELLPIVFADRKTFYGILFECVHATLLAVCANPANLGARVGGLSVLHTWNQKLAIHPHIHVIIPGGGISSDGLKWIKGSATFLASVKRLSKVFRGKLLSALESSLNKGDLYTDATMVRTALRKAAGKDFVVYAKQPFGGPEQVLKYLGRYTHRVGISEQRIVSITDNTVSFSYTNRSAGYAKETMTICDEEFIKKFMLHILPKGLRKIRYFGYMANRDRGVSLKKVNTLIIESGAALSEKINIPDVTDIPDIPDDTKTLEKTESICSKCGRTMTVIFIARPFAANSLSDCRKQIRTDYGCFPGKEVPA